jgi:outer membrane protein TolC
MLTTDIQDTLPVPGLPVAARMTSFGALATDTLGTTAPDTAGYLATAVALADTAADERATVRQARENVRAQEGLVRVARAQRFPELTLSTQYGRLAYPTGGIPEWAQFVDNWTVTLGLRMPLFTGGRIRGDELIAQADLLEARARYEQVRELAALDARATVAQLQQAQAAWAASVGTVEQASRAYTIAEVRYREGISTQLELSESRNLLQQATANRAMAARDLQVARIRLALLKDLPLSSEGGAASGGQSPQQRPQQQPQRPQQPAAGAGVAQTGFGGGPTQ